MFLTLRTDRPEAEIGLYDGTTRLDYQVWHAHRQLSVQLHRKLQELLAAHGKTWSDVDGFVCFQGPGSFTGLRIGLAVANALAEGLGVPIVACQGEEWVKQGVKRLVAGQNDHLALPHYGAPVHITTPKT